jgi:hypothetical protein
VIPAERGRRRGASEDLRRKRKTGIFLPRLRDMAVELFGGSGGKLGRDRACLAEERTFLCDEQAASAGRGQTPRPVGTLESALTETCGDDTPARQSIIRHIAAR